MPKMNRLFKKLCHRDCEYHDDEFSVRIEAIVREALSVIHTRQGMHLALSGERIGGKWEAIEVHIPKEVEAARVSQVVVDLEIAFQALGYGYVIARLTGVEVVPETERQAAIAGLHEMGYDTEVSADRKKVRQKRSGGVPFPDVETARKQSPRMMSLVRAVHGERQCLEILAKSKDF